MSYTLVFHPLTGEDYNEAFAWYEEKQKGLGERFIIAVRQKIEQIADHPQAHGSKSNKNLGKQRLIFFLI